MSEITISEEMHTRVAEFKQVVEAVIEEEIDFDAYVEMILEQGIEAMVDQLLGSLEQPTLLKMFQQLGSLYPAQAYQYIVETLGQGSIITEQKEMKRRLGFPLPTDADSAER